MIGTRPTIPADRYRERMAAAQALATEAGLAAILVGVGPDLRYLTGYPAMPSERLTMLVIPATGEQVLVAPVLEATPARSCPPAAADLLRVVTWAEADDAHWLVASMLRDAEGGSSAAPSGDLRIAVSDDLPARHLLRLSERLPGARLKLASPILGRLRIVKDAGFTDLTIAKEKPYSLEKDVPFGLESITLTAEK